MSPPTPRSRRGLLPRVAALLVACAIGSVSQAQKPPVVISPEVHEDGTVTFRMLAPRAQAVLVQGLRHMKDQAMTKDASGVWSVTVGPFEADIYSYTFSIDGATVTDPHDRDIKKYFSSESLFEVPGHPPILAEAQSVPHGIIHHQVYASKVRKADAGMWIYTPPAYDPRADAQYPVVYLLHGYGDHEEAWIDAGHANTIVDNLIAQGKIAPIIVVMPYGHPVPVDQRKEFDDYAGKNLAAMQKDVLDDIIPIIERDYRADPSPEKRAIVGLSMGGGQSLAIGLGNPEKFKWVGGFSSAAPEKDLETTFATIIKDPAARPHLIWIGVGKDDFLLKRNEAFHAWLEKEGIAHSWNVSEGAHEWPVWRSYLPQFLELIFR